MKAVFTIAILDFTFGSDAEEPDKFRHDVKLSDVETYKVFYDKLALIYLEMPTFKKSVEQLSSRFEKWMYVIRDLNKLDRVTPPTTRGYL